MKTWTIVITFPADTPLTAVENIEDEILETLQGTGAVVTVEQAEIDDEQTP